MQKRAKKTAKVGDEVLILDVPWHEDGKYIGMVVKLDNKVSMTEWASAMVDGYSVVISKYIPATELNKTLF